MKRKKRRGTIAARENKNEKKKPKVKYSDDIADGREGTNGSTCNLQTHAELLSQEKKTGKKEATRYAIFSARCFVFLSCAFFHSIVPNSTHTHRHTHSLTLAKKRKPLTSIPLSIKWISTLLSNLKKEKERDGQVPQPFFFVTSKNLFIYDAFVFR